MHQEMIEFFSVHSGVPVRFEAIYQDPNHELRSGQRLFYPGPMPRLTVIKGMAAPPPIAHKLEMNTMILSFVVANRYSLENDPGDGEKASCFSRIAASLAGSMSVTFFSELPAR